MALRQNLRRFPKPTRYRDQLGDLWINGEFFMGRYRTPPMPNYIIMTDRVTNAQKALTNDDSLSAVVLSDVQPMWPDRSYFGPHDGPYSGDYRLYLSNGTLAFEHAPGYNSPRILTRNAFQPTVLEITASPSGALVTTTVTL